MEIPTWLIAIFTAIMAIATVFMVFNDISEVQKYLFISISISLILLFLIAMTFSYLNDKINSLNR